MAKLEEVHPAFRDAEQQVDSVPPWLVAGAALAVMLAGAALVVAGVVAIVLAVTQ